MNLLSDIITYIRRIVKTPSDQILSDSLIIDYINRFYLYDCPARLQLFDLKTTFQLVTSPNIDQYNMPYTGSAGTPDGVITYQGLLSPVYCDGVEMPFTTSRSFFFRSYPNFDFNQQDALGDGGASYSIQSSIFPIVRGHLDVLDNLVPGLYITALDSTNNQMLVTDSGEFDGSDNNIGILTGDGTGTIDYLTGEVDVVFNNSVPDQNIIQLKYANYQAGTPRIVLFYNNIITIRPVPDTAYLIQFDAYLTPSAFLNNQEALPFGYMSEWLARGASRKILSDTGDYEQFAFHEPLFREQENLVLRRSDRQNCVNRTPTIFTDRQNQSGYWNG